ncbi:MAG TPA: hypothetical protein VGF55_26905 [Gemmataceae bacterium]
MAPADAGFCVVVQGLRDQVARLEKSPFAARLAASPYGKAVRESPEVRKLAHIDEQLRTHLNVSWAQLRDDILGDAVVLAYTPGPPDHPEAEQGLLLVHARRPDLLAGLLDRLNDQQQKAGELTAVDRREHRGQGYVVRRKKAGGTEVYFLRGPVLAFTDSEAALRAAIDRDQNARPADADPPTVSARLRALGVDRDFVVWWVNPRAFDAALAAKVASVKGVEAAILGAFERYWKALDGAAVSVALGRDPTVNLAVQARTDALPAPARRLLAEAARPSAVWASFPDNALFAAAGRVPWDAAAEAGSEFLTADARRDVQDAVERTVGAILGRDVLPQLLRHLGPDWGVCVMPPESGDRGWLPSLTAVLRLRPGEGKVPVEQRVLDGLDFVARLAVLGYNGQRTEPLRLRVESQDGVDVRVIEGGRLPPGLQPAFAWKGGYLVLASTPEAVRRFVPPTRAADAAPEPAEVPLVRLTLQGWAGYLRAYRGPVAAHLAEADKIPVAEAQARIDRWLDGLDLFDGVEVVQRTAAGRATVTVRLKTLPRTGE